MDGKPKGMSILITMLLVTPLLLSSATAINRIVTVGEKLPPSPGVEGLTDNEKRGVMMTVGLNTPHPQVGVSAPVNVTLYGLAEVSSVEITYRYNETRLRVQDDNITGPIALSDGEVLGYSFNVTPLVEGHCKLNITVDGRTVENAFETSRIVLYNASSEPRAGMLTQQWPEDPGVGTADSTATSTATSSSTVKVGSRDMPIMFLNGLDPTGPDFGRDVNGEYQEIYNALGDWGWSEPMAGWGFYECDSDYTHHVDLYGNHFLHLAGQTFTEAHAGGSCAFAVASGSHTSDTSIEHIAFHWAQGVATEYDCVKAVGHSMGGNIIRYALAQVDAGHEDFPSSLCVEDVATLGAPHAGTGWADGCGWYQCVQLRHDSGHINWLGNNANNPQTPDTDWTLMGATGDDIVSGSEATTNMNPAHAVVYEEEIDHSDSSGIGVHWKSATSSDINAEIRWTDAALGSEETLPSAPWPIRHMDMSLNYDLWGCGKSQSSAWPTAQDTTVVGEPYTSTFDCWYKFDVPSGYDEFVVELNDLKGVDRDLYVYDPSGNQVCSGTSLDGDETCTITNPGAGTWNIKVYNYAQTRDPFSLRAYVQDTHDLTGVSITSAPSSVAPGDTFQVCWDVDGNGDIDHTNIHWGTSSGSYDQFTNAQTGTAPDSFCDSITAPSSEGTVYMKAHGSGPNDDLYSNEHSVTVESSSGGGDSSTLGEAGRQTDMWDATWYSESLSESYGSTPLVFATTQTVNGDQDPSQAHVRGVSTSGFETQHCEVELPNGCDYHNGETNGWVAVDPGDVNGVSGMETGTFSISNDVSKSVSFSSSFSSTPLVFAQVQTDNGAEAPKNVQVTSTSTTGFTLEFCEQETTDGCDTSHTSETVAWWAVDPSTASKGGAFDWGTVSVTDSGWEPVSFSFSNSPVVVAMVQTENGAQEALYSEVKGVSTSGADVRYCEYDGNDECDVHATETVAWLAVEPGSINYDGGSSSNVIAQYDGNIESSGSYGDTGSFITFSNVQGTAPITVTYKYCYIADTNTATAYIYTLFDGSTVDSFGFTTPLNKVGCTRGDPTTYASRSFTVDSSVSSSVEFRYQNGDWRVAIADIVVEES